MAAIQYSGKIISINGQNIITSELGVVHILRKHGRGSSKRLLGRERGWGVWGNDYWLQAK